MGFSTNGETVNKKRQLRQEETMRYENGTWQCESTHKG